MEYKSWHNCRYRSYPRIPATAYCHVPNWRPHLVPFLGMPDAHQLQAQIISRAMKLLRFCPITPAHRKPPWPGYKHGLRLFTKLLVAHPLVGVCLPPEIRPAEYLKLTGYMVGSLFIWFVCLCFCVFLFCLCLVLFLVFVSLFLGVLPGFLDERDSA